MGILSSILAPKQAEEGSKKKIPAKLNTSTLQAALAKGAFKQQATPLAALGNLGMAFALRRQQAKQSESDQERSNLLAEALAGGDFATAAAINPALAVQDRTSREANADRDASRAQSASQFQEQINLKNLVVIPYLS